MEIEKLNPKERIPDTYRDAVIRKLEELNEKLKIVKEQVGVNEPTKRTNLCYEIKWLKGNYIYTDVNGAGLWNDLVRIKGLIEKVDFWYNFPNNKYKKEYVEYFLIENNDD